MLRNMIYQLNPDKDEQKKTEDANMPMLMKKFHVSINRFSQAFPQFETELKRDTQQNFLPFLTRKKHLNIANYHLGRALYDSVPEPQIATQLDDFERHALWVDPNKPASEMLESHALGDLGQIYPQLKKAYHALPHASGLDLVILGCGFGLHLQRLLTLRPWRHVLLIEPNFDLLRASMFSGEWPRILNTLQHSGVQLSILSGEQGKSCLSKLMQWVTEVKSSGFYLYRHYDFGLFNQLEFRLANASVRLCDFNAQDWETTAQPNDYECSYMLPHYFCALTSEERDALTLQATEKYTTNLDDLTECFPDLVETFSQYDSQRWSLFIDNNKKLNLINKLTGRVFYQSDIENYAKEQFEAYSQRPLLNAISPVKAIRKDSPYIHYKHSDLLKDLLQAIPEEENATLPTKLPMMLVYGMGLGCQLDILYDKHDVDSLIIYEPEPDFFYFSLFTISWKKFVLGAQDKNKGAYINIGDDGSNLFSDINDKLLINGANRLGYSFFYVSYYTDALFEAVKSVNEKFQILTNLCETFDDVFYNFTHTNEAMRRGCYHLLKARESVFSRRLGNMPVFIIGNGPSLDNSAEYIKQHKDKAILISCGTSLKALYHLGIQPDFHVELEQTRATRMWIEQVPDKAWLKQIDLLTVNGVHPEVIDLFNDTYICMKRGEPATALYSTRVEGFEEQIDGTVYSFPTVTNCAIALTTRLGFNELYLFGVDLGFKDQTQHHSKHSAYYQGKDKKELYDYSQHGTGICVKGNFEEKVFTKWEFRYSAEIIAKNLTEFRHVDCFNTSDGAFIERTKPLHFKDILLLNPAIDKAMFKKELQKACFTQDMQHIVDFYHEHFTLEDFEENINGIIALWQSPAASQNEALELMRETTQKTNEAVFSKRSLYFLLMRGSSSYVMTHLTRLLFSSNDESICLARFEQGRQIWLSYLNEVKDKYLKETNSFDQTLAPLQGVSFGPNEHEI